VSSNIPLMARYTRCNIMLYRLSVTCDRSVVFSGPPVSFTNKTDRHDITEILLKVALNTLTLTLTLYAVSGFINTILSWKGFIPLSRLTYCAYLIHPIVMYYFYMSRRQLIHWDTHEIVSIIKHFTKGVGDTFSLIPPLFSHVLLQHVKKTPDSLGLL